MSTEGFESGISTKGAIGISIGVIAIAITALGIKLVNWQPPVNHVQPFSQSQPVSQPQPTAGGKRRTRRARRGTRRV